INARLAVQNGHTVQEHIGRTPHELRVPIADDIEKMFRYVVKTGQPIENMELTGPDRDLPNGVRHWLNSYHPACDSGGKMIGVVASALDITSLKEAETEKNALVDQLHQSQKTEALCRLTGGVAHDFNNMLGVILGTLEFVAERNTDASLTPLIQRIRGAAERAGDLVQRLSAFARQQPLNPRAVNVAELIQNLVRLLSRSIEAQIDIRCITPEELWLAEVDPSQLEAAILNLAINARDAMPQGGKLTIEASNVPMAEDDVAFQPDLAVGDYVMIVLSDTGTGMSKDTIAKAFEPFFTTKDVGRGSGLGLSMVQGFIKQSRGHIQVYSELGVGTVMKLYVPRAHSAQTEEREVVVEKPVGHAEVVLVVEDDDMVRETAVELLQILGYQTLVARSGVEALPILESQQHIDVLFTDIVMPGGIDGAVLAKKAIQMRPGLPVVFASGYTDNALGHQGQLPANTIFVQKPYRGGGLAKKIRTALDGALQPPPNS
ncbi:MAG: response regulator, partial [Rhodospirillaceae bacterium]|nr:response regulator [Rhodospirillaceae bacterium]